MSKCVYVGIDWAYRTHAVCVIDRNGVVLKRAPISHDRDGLAELLRLLRAFGKSLRIAIERPSGLLVDVLLDAGHQVIPIHPNAVKACRPRYGSTNAKNDAGDAFMLADLLRTDGHRWQPLQSQSCAILGLRALVRTRDDLVASRLRLANQLTALLDSYWPGATAIFASIDSPIALAFIEQWPAPRELTERQIAAFCKRHAYSGRRPASVLLQRLQQAAQSPCDAALAQARASAALALVTVLKPIVQQIKTLDSQIATADNSRHDSPWAAHVSNTARTRGCDHPHAVRVLARAWTRILWRLWIDGTTYNPAMHQAACNLELTTGG